MTQPSLSLWKTFGPGIRVPFQNLPSRTANFVGLLSTGLPAATRGT